MRHIRRATHQEAVARFSAGTHGHRCGYPFGEKRRVGPTCRPTHGLPIHDESAVFTFQPSHYLFRAAPPLPPLAPVVSLFSLSLSLVVERHEIERW